MSRHLFILPFLWLIFVFRSNAQEKMISKGNQQWFQYYNEARFSDKWLLLVDGGFRWKNGFDQLSKYVSRINFAFLVNEKMRLGSGFAHSGRYQSGKMDEVEFRPFQEFVLQEKYGQTGLSHRFRVEQRIFRNVHDGEILETGSFIHRFRYRISLSIPLFKLSKDRADREVSLGLSEEVFIHAGKDVVYNVFNQNRIVIGPSLKWNEKLTIRINYNSQFAAANAPAQFSYTNIFWLGIQHKLNFEGEKPKD